jgi:hypothetical protein
LHPDVPLATLLTADSVTICIANTKNGTKNAVVHHEAVGGYLCPVAAIAQQLDNIKQGFPTCSISTVFHISKQPIRVQTATLLSLSVGVHQPMDYWHKATP